MVKLAALPGPGNPVTFQLPAFFTIRSWSDADGFFFC